MFGIAACFLALAAPIDNFDAAFRAVSGRPDREKSAALVKWFGAPKSAVVRINERRAVFLVPAPANARSVRVASDDPKWTRGLRRLEGESGYWAGAVAFREDTAFRWRSDIDGQPSGGGELEAYAEPPEIKPAPENLRGTLTEQEPFRAKTYPGTTRRWWIYVPKAYDPAKPAALYIIQDAQWSRGYWVPVLDNMIGTGQIPAAIAVFLTPGTITNDLDNRSVEYDTVSDRYPTMLIEEIIPAVEKRYNIRKDPAGRLVAGLSSGGICAFNAAWQRPDAFGKAVSWIGSFTNLQGGPTGVAGGNTYPAMIRALRGWDQKGAPKPIRVFLQDGRNDLDNRAGNWPLANQDMAKALEFGAYDFRFVMGNGFHSHRHGLVLLPETLRWMWRDEPVRP